MHTPLTLNAEPGLEPGAGLGKGSGTGHERLDAQTFNIYRETR